MSRPKKATMKDVITARLGEDGYEAMLDGITVEEYRALRMKAFRACANMIIEGPDDPDWDQYAMDLRARSSLPSMPTIDRAEG